MYRHFRPFIHCFAVFIFLITGCSQNTPNEEVKNEDAAPEQVFREFLIANLKPDEDKIRNLIIDQKDAAVLWSTGSYPEKVAEMLTAQYKQIEIVRVDDYGNDPDRVLLNSSATPTPIHVIKINGVWKVDAGPIIEFRVMAQKNQNK